MAQQVIKSLFFSAVIFLLTGCATSRGYLNITVPQESAAKNNGMQVYIHEIKDSRQFQLRPPSPDIPSLSKKDIASEDLKSRAIGRKRNGYGKALGSIFLEENQNVQGVIYEAAKNSLISLGYEVTNDKEKARADAIVMDISIDKFWSWVNMGMWTLRVDAEIKTTVSEPALSKTFVVQALAQNHCQVGSTANWKKALRMAIEDYMSDFKNKLK
jgi:uncharacterized lipoprotein YajG